MAYVKLFSNLALAIALAYFAYALTLVANEVKQTREEIPQLMTQIEHLENTINIEAWLALSKNLDGQVPLILKEAAAIRQTVNHINQNVPNILQEIQALRTDTVPPVLAEIKAIRLETLPPVLTEVRTLNTTTVPDVLSEVALIRTQTIPPVLSEVAAVRKMTPETLNKVEALVNQAQSAASDASAGAVEGTVKGVLLTPFKLLESAGKTVVDEGKKLTDDK